jgi:hypothetical protein
VPYRDLQAAWLEDDGYAAEIMDLFDADSDGQLDATELILDSAEKEALIAGRLAARGLDEPRIFGDVRPYGVNHNVIGGEWAIKDCQVCHSDESRVNDAIALADRLPGGVIPAFVNNATVTFSGDLVVNNDGELTY